MKNPLSKDGRIARLEADVAELMRSVEENRRLNERLSDVLDVMTELLVPAVGRDDARLKAALDTLAKSRQRAADEPDRLARPTSPTDEPDR